MTAKEFQDIITPQIGKKLNELEVISEWRAFQGLPYQYSPRVDIAVGPFSIESGRNRTREYNGLLQQEAVNQFLREIYTYHIDNIGEQWLNEIDIPEF